MIFLSTGRTSYQFYSCRSPATPAMAAAAMVCSKPLPFDHPTPHAPPLALRRMYPVRPRAATGNWPGLEDPSQFPYDPPSCGRCPGRRNFEPTLLESSPKPTTVSKYTHADIYSTPRFLSAAVESTPCPTLCQCGQATKFSHTTTRAPISLGILNQTSRRDKPMRRAELARKLIANWADRSDTIRTYL